MKTPHLLIIVVYILLASLVACSSGDSNNSADAANSEIFETPGVGIGEEPDDDGGGDSGNNSDDTDVTVTLTGIRFSAGSDSIVVKEGTTYQLNIVGVYSDGSTENLNSLVTWTSSNPSVFSIIADGLFSAAAQGTVTVTASYENLPAVEISVTIEAKSITSVLIVPRPQGDGEILPVSNSFDTYFILKAQYDNATEGVITENVTWTCQDPEGKSLINPYSGKFSPHDSTAVSITIGAEYSGYNDDIPIYIDDTLVLQTVELKIYQGDEPGEDEHPTSLTIVEEQSANVMVLATYLQGDNEVEVNITNNITWDITNGADVELEQGGSLQAQSIATDSVVVTIDIEDFEGVNPSPVTLTIEKKELVAIAFEPGNSEVVVGSQFQLSATAYYNNGTSEDLTSLSAAGWDSSNDNLEVDSVENPGFVTAVEDGIAAIRVKKCKDGDQWNSCESNPDEYLITEKTITVYNQTLTSLKILTNGTTVSSNYHSGAIDVDFTEPFPVGMKTKLTVMGYYDEGPVSEMDLSRSGKISLSVDDTDLTLCSLHDSPDRTDDCWVKATGTGSAGTITAEYTSGLTTDAANDLDITTTDEELVLFNVNQESGGTGHRDSLIILEGQSKQLKLFKQYSVSTSNETVNADFASGVTWGFSDDGVVFTSHSDKVSIDADGKITGDALGSPVLKASLEGYQGTLTRLISIEVKSSTVTLDEWYTGVIDKKVEINLSFNFEETGDYTITFISQEKENLDEDFAGSTWLFFPDTPSHISFPGTSVVECHLNHEHPRVTIRVTETGEKNIAFDNTNQFEQNEETVFSLKISRGGGYPCSWTQ